jgi:PAS domain S-box-containing protein
VVSGRRLALNPAGILRDSPAQDRPTRAQMNDGPMRDRTNPLILNISHDGPEREATTRILRQAGYDVLEAATGQEAVRLAEAGAQLLLLDVNLDDGNGFDVRRRIKANPRTSAIPVVHVSATYASAADRFAALAEGADACLTQPVDALDLVAVVRSSVRLKVAEEALRVRESSYRTVVESASDGIFCADAAGHFVDVNTMGCRMLGYSLEEVLALGVADIVATEDLERVGPELARLHVAEVVRSVWQCRRKDGTLFPGEVGATVLPGGLLVGTLRDVTERNQLEELQRNRESELMEAQRLGRMGSFQWTVATGTLGWSEGLKLILRRDVNLPSPTFDTLARFYTPESWQHLMRSAATMIETGLPEEQELEMIRDDGTRCWTRMRGEALRGPDGSVVAIRGIVHDVDERKRAEEELRNGENKHRVLFEDSADANMLLDEAGFLNCNSAALQMFGYASQAEFNSLHPADLSPPNQPDGAPSLTAADERIGAALLNGKNRFEWMHRRKNGEDFPAEVCLTALTLSGRRVLLATVRDTTDRMRAEAELRLQGAALNAASDAMLITDRNGTIAWINPAFTALTGYGADDAIGRNPRELIKSGVHDQAFYKRLWNTILAGNVWRGEMTNRRKDGSRHPDEVTITPVKDADGAITHFIAITRDLTERRQMEARFLNAQRMEAVGTLAGGIAHDFNNILGAMLGCTELAAMDAEGNPAVLKNLAQVTAAGHRAAALVQHILAFSGQQGETRKSIHLDSVVGEALALLRASLPASIELRSTFDQAAPAVLADPAQIHQIVMNLGINAAHAMNDRPGVIDVTIDAVDADPELFGGRMGRYARFSMRDTGRGIDPATRARIFEPFFTTKAPGEGTGLGLATVHGIMKSCNGEILVSSKVGEGTTFRLYFPATDDAAAAVGGREEAPPRGDGQHILYVDDEASLVAWGSGMLEQLGYRVTGRSSVLEALADVTEHPEIFDLVVTDMTMPVMTGLQFAERIRAARPDLPVILTTGYSAALTSEAVHPFGIEALLVKPIAFNTLADAVDRVLRLEK